MKRFSLTILVILMAIPSAWADDVLQVQFKSHITSPGNSIQLKDVIDNEHTDLEFMQRYGNMTLNALKSDAEKIEPMQIMALLGQSGADMTKIQFKQFGSIALERGQTVELPNTLKQKIISDIAVNYGIPEQDIGFGATRVLPKLPSEQTNDLKFSQIVIHDLSHLDQVKVTAFVEDQNGHTTTHDFSVALNINTNTLTAAQDIPAGSPLQTSKYWSARSKLTELNGRILLPDAVKDKTLRTNTNIQKGAVILANAVDETQAVTRGKVVTVSYKTAQIDIKTQGTLLDDAEVGSLVRVENLESKRSVTGRLLSKDLVEVAHAK